MAHLSLSFLGPLQVALDGQPVTEFKSNKVRALLAYLAVEFGRPHRRDVLAGLLWAEWPDSAALSNLRFALSNLRKVLGDQAAALPGQEEDRPRPPFLLVTRETLQFNTDSNYSLDVTAFAQLADQGIGDPAHMDKLAQAVDLYRGGFLEEFSLGDCPAFEEWALLMKERLARKMSCALHHLATAHCEQGTYGQAQRYARRQLELEPWDEEAHQLLMRALALGGQRSAALAQYEACRRLLAEELAVGPADGTTSLYEQIRDGKLMAPAPVPAPPRHGAIEEPPFLSVEKQAVDVPAFVARDDELARLNGFLERAMAGRGLVAFVTGEAGSGKTLLTQEFSRRALAPSAGAGGRLAPNLVVASGNCNAYTGIGDPYLPFREILGLLAGDVQSRWSAGAMSSEHARRLWSLVPATAQAVAEAGPDLIDTFIPGEGLLQRARASAPGGAAWQSRLERLAGLKSTDPGTRRVGQHDLFEQFTRVLQILAQRDPMLLIVDDLQWADPGSISLLFHLGRQLAGNRILLLGAYRPEEVALGRDGERHALATVINELQRAHGDIVVNLGQAKHRELVDSLLDTEPNLLGTAFRERLYKHTHGHPLFTVELLRGLQDHGDLIQDQEGHWIEGESLNWEMLPARVEAVISERIGRLPPELARWMAVASVEGEDFHAEVVAQVTGTGERQVVQQLSIELDKRHRLVRAQAIERIGSRRASRYRFRNYLFQKYLYDSLDQVDRAYLHEDVGNALEELYRGQTGRTEAAEATAEVAVQLARHFEEAGVAEKAIFYLHQAGDRAVKMSAYREGIDHLTRALALLRDLPPTGARDQQELGLQISLGMAHMPTERSVPLMAEAFVRARELCRRTGRASDLHQTLGQLATTHYVRAELGRARTLAEEALDLAQQAGEPPHVALAHWRLGFILFAQGEHTQARFHLGQMSAFYERQYHELLVSLCGSDAGISAVAYDACCLWCLGYPDQALVQGRKALALSQEMGHPFTRAEIVSFAGCMPAAMRRDGKALQQSAGKVLQLVAEKGLPTFLGFSTWQRGEALVLLGQPEEGMAEIRQGIATSDSTEVRVYWPRALAALGEAKAQAGQVEDGLATLSEALALVAESGEHLWETEIYRLQAELLLLLGEESAAENSLRQAIGVARRQEARSWELRAQSSLARLWQEQGKEQEARQRLAEVYGWFTEGFDTPDLVEARALLRELSG